jgi:hypothetical protein
VWIVDSRVQGLGFRVYGLGFSGTLTVPSKSADTKLGFDVTSGGMLLRSRPFEFI